MQITNEAIDIINHYLNDVSETISSIEDALQLNKEFNNLFDIDAYLNNYKKYKDYNILDNGKIYCLWETLYESILLWGFNYFSYKLWEYEIYLNHWYYDYLYKYYKWELQRHMDSLTTEQIIKLIDDHICKYFIHKFSLDIKI